MNSEEEWWWGRRRKHIQTNPPIDFSIQKKIQRKMAYFPMIFFILQTLLKTCHFGIVETQSANPETGRCR